MRGRYPEVATGGSEIAGGMHFGLISDLPVNLIKYFSSCTKKRERVLHAPFKYFYGLVNFNELLIFFLISIR